jgi:hypothetical protein
VWVQIDPVLLGTPTRASQPRFEASCPVAVAVKVVVVIDGQQGL